MKRIRILSAVLPLFALAACGNDSAPSVTEPVQLIGVKSRGEIVATQLCAQCHGTDFFGKSMGAAVCPALDKVGTFSFAHFEAVLAAITEREGSAMVAVDNAFDRLTPEDRRALYEYLGSLLQQP